jgi:hypothetical protein
MLSGLRSVSENERLELELGASVAHAESPKIGQTHRLCGRTRTECSWIGIGDISEGQWRAFIRHFSGLSQQMPVDWDRALAHLCPADAAGDPLLPTYYSSLDWLGPPRLHGTLFKAKSMKALAPGLPEALRISDASELREVTVCSRQREREQ